jgi:hypothetical protein
MASESSPPPAEAPPPVPGNKLAVFWHEGMLAHDAGRGVFDSGRDPGFLDVLDQHPENADRVRNMVSILRRGPIAHFLSWHSGRPAHASELRSFHSSGQTPKPKSPHRLSCIPSTLIKEVVLYKV